MINKVILVGRLTADPELRQTQSGVSVTSITVACNRSYVKDKQSQQADFINCVAWRGTAEFICKYFRKGNTIGIEGSIQTRKYTDKNGNNRVAVEVLIENVSFIEKKKHADTPPLPQEPPYQKSAEQPSQNVSYQNGSDNFEDLEAGDDDLPF